MARNIFDYNDSEPKAEQKATQTAEELIEHYKGFSQEELIRELLSAAEKEKQNGTLSREKLENIKSTILPYLNQNQIEFLEKLIERLNV